MKKAACIALGLGFALAASAAEPAVGSIQDVKGAVTVSSTQAVKRAANGTPVVEGASILVASDASATLVLNNGCVIGLKGSQHLTVSTGLKCEQLQASAKQLFPAYQLAQAPLGGGIVPPPAAQAETERRAAALPWGGAGADGMAIGALGGVIGIAMFPHSDSSRASGQ